MDFTDNMHLPVNILLALGKNPYELTLQRFLLKKNRVADLHFSNYYDFVPSTYPGFEIEHLVDPGLIFSVPEDEDKDENGGQGVVPPSLCHLPMGMQQKLGQLKLRLQQGWLFPTLRLAGIPPYPPNR